jgi:hypothetical protein
VIPQNTQELSKDWANDSSLTLVTFESSSSLRKMIETAKIDLNPEWEIKFAKSDCELNFAGYSVEAVQGVNDSFHLVKITSET